MAGTSLPPSRAKGPPVTPEVALPHPDEGKLSVVRLPNGTVFFQTERFEPVQLKQTKGTIRGETAAEEKFVIVGAQSDVNQLELVFQIVNRSDQLVTLTSLKVIPLGKIVKYEDTLEKEWRSNDVLENREYSVQRERVDLGAIVFADGVIPRPGERAGELMAENLLPPDEVEVLQPDSLKSYRVKARCRGNNTVRFDVRDSSSITTGTTLSGLDFGWPEPIGAAHVFAISVEILTSEGRRARIYSDQIYALFPRPTGEAKMVVLMTSDLGPLVLERWLAAPPEVFVPQILDWAIPTYRETLAYRIAKETGEITSDFDPDAVSPFCYRGDNDSPFRRSMKIRELHREPDKLEGLIIRADFFDPQPRSDLVLFFQRSRDNHPDLWNEMSKQITKCSAASGTLARKALYVRKKLE